MIKIGRKNAKCRKVAFLRVHWATPPFLKSPIFRELALWTKYFGIMEKISALENDGMS